MTARRDGGKAGVDWDAVRARLAHIARAVSGGVTNQRREQRILRQRAQSLAEVPDEPLSHDVLIEVVCFPIGTQAYAIETDYIVEIAALDTLTAVPATPDHLLGVSNLKGRIIPLFDLAALFGGDQSNDTYKAYLVLGRGLPDFGLAVAGIDEVLQLDRRTIERPGVAPDVVEPNIRGVTPDGLVVLDGARLLSDPRLILDSEREK